MIERDLTSTESYLLSLIKNELFGIQTHPSISSYIQLAFKNYIENNGNSQKISIQR